MNVSLDVLVFAVVIVAIVIAVGYWRQRHSDPAAARKRELVRNEMGELVRIGDLEVDSPRSFNGTGTWSSQPIHLARGNYRVAYRFPPDVFVRVGLVSSLDGDEETLLIKSGSGVEGFELEGAPYIIQVQPADESAEWQLEFQRMKRFRVEE